LVKINKTKLKNNMQKRNIIFLISELWKHLSTRRKKQFFLLILLILSSSLAELISIGLILPFLAVLVSPEELYKYSGLMDPLKDYGIYETKEILFLISTLFILATIFAAIIRLLFVWASTKFSNTTGADLSLEIYRRTLYQPYKVHISRNSSEVISGITIKANSITASVLSPIIDILGSFIVIFSIITYLISIEPIISIVSFGSFALIYVFITFSIRNKLSKTSKDVSINSSRLLKSLQEGLGGIRDVLINGNQEVYCKVYAEADRSVRKAHAESAFMGSSPKILIEALGIIFIVSFSYFIITKFNKTNSLIPMLGSMAFSAQKILPMMQLIYQGWTRILAAEWVLVDVLNLLNQALPSYFGNKENHKANPFINEIKLTNLGFSYNEDAKFSIKNININITKGMRVGFVGKTGSGKSTLIDLIMGLLEPTTGSIIIDDLTLNKNNVKNWHNLIAHVPQSIFLSDATIAENVALGCSIESLDIQRIHLSLEQAQILDFINTLEDGIYTKVGERGIRLSGGQKQRIGIARALYKKASVIVFDEATSALDNETEKAVMDSIDKLDKHLTILIIAHRLTSLKNCDKIISLENGEIKKIGNYSDLLS
jgi:ATP-binding cassette, subfamily B, bacterial PglK